MKSKKASIIRVRKHPDVGALGSTCFVAILGLKLGVDETKDYEITI